MRPMHQLNNLIGKTVQSTGVIADSGKPTVDQIFAEFAFEGICAGIEVGDNEDFLPRCGIDFALLDEFASEAGEGVGFATAGDSADCHFAVFVGEDFGLGGAELIGTHCVSIIRI